MGTIRADNERPRQSAVNVDMCCLKPILRWFTSEGFAVHHVSRRWDQSRDPGRFIRASVGPKWETLGASGTGTVVFCSVGPHQPELSHLARCHHRGIPSQRAATSASTANQSLRGSRQGLSGWRQGQRSQGERSSGVLSLTYGSSDEVSAAVPISDPSQATPSPSGSNP